VRSVSDYFPMTDAAGQPGPRLGELLIQHGVVTPQQLDVALAEQQQTGRPLGEIIVDRGFAPGPMVAQALATQHGGMVKTEYGFATGFQAVVRAAEAAPAGDPRDLEILRLKADLASRDGEIERLRAMVEHLRVTAIR
jgi:hypothetical protein